MKKKEQKKANNTTKESILPKNGEAIPFENPPEYHCLRTHGMHPARTAYVDKLFHEFYEYARDNDDALFLGDFLTLKGIPRQTWENWYEKNPQRYYYYKEGMEAIGRRREKRAFEREYAEKTIHFMQSLYSKDWKAQQKEHAELSLEGQKNQPITVVMQSYKEEDKE